MSEEQDDSALEWEALIDLMIDGEPTQDDVCRLEAFLRTSSTARRDYRSAMELVANLEADTLTSKGGEVVSGLPSPTATQSKRNGRIVKTKWRVAMAACLAGGVGFLLSHSYFNGKPPPIEPRGIAVAEMGRMDEVRWKNTGWTSGQAMVAGDQIRVISGRTEVVFGSGARGVLIGPGSLEVTSPTSCKVFGGKFQLTSPPGLRFFLVESSAGTVTGMDADFAIRQVLGTTEVHVFRGAASIDAIEPKTSDSTRSSVVELEAGRGLRFEGTRVDSIVADERQFVSAESLTLRSQIVALEDEFTGDQVDKELWTTYRPEFADVAVTAGVLALSNRGYLITKKEFHPVADGGLRITGIWRFVNADANAGNGGVDSFHVLTRCNPAEGEYYRQAAAGIDFHFHSRDFRPRIEAIGGEVKLTGARVEGELKLDLTGPIAFEVIDDGRLLSLTIWDPANPQNRSSATAELVSGEATKHHIVFYNRERYSPVSPQHRSHLDDVRIIIGQGPAWLSGQKFANQTPGRNPWNEQP